VTKNQAVERIGKPISIATLGAMLGAILTSIAILKVPATLGREQGTLDQRVKTLEGVIPTMVGEIDKGIAEAKAAAALAKKESIEAVNTSEIRVLGAIDKVDAKLDTLIWRMMPAPGSGSPQPHR
jgi:hypothetical protein